MFKKYNIIQYKGKYQVQKRIWLFFWRTIEHYDDSIDMYNKKERANHFRRLYCFDRLHEALKYLEYYKKNYGQNLLYKRWCNLFGY